MIEITFSAFSFLKQKCKEKGLNCSNAKIEIPENMSVRNLIEYLHLDNSDVEAVFINHKILSKDTVLNNADKVAIVPPGGIPNHIAAYIGKN